MNGKMIALSISLVMAFCNFAFAATSCEGKDNNEVLREGDGTVTVNNPKVVYKDSCLPLGFKLYWTAPLLEDYHTADKFCQLNGLGAILGVVYESVCDDHSGCDTSQLTQVVTLIDESPTMIIGARLLSLHCSGK